MDVLNCKPRAARLEGKVFVQRKLVCEAVIMCQVVPRPPKVVNISEDPSALSGVSAKLSEDAPELEPVNQE